ncbi:retrovirus-related Pol polyprotein from type-1 retrotransposable element R1 [Bombyx mori]|uniref:retrovirus-related Pol polyprotein from type-1 retrotransposable element R1 n=1 Tax=Bombyx mori TaxID=7091 RepID=UPI002ED16E1F
MGSARSGGFTSKSSTNTPKVFEGLLPLDLRIHEAAALYEAKRGVSQLATGDGEMERMTKFADIPHPAKHIDLQFICLEDREQVDTHSTQTVRIYTDGSKIDGKVGASLSFWSNEVETKCKKLKLSSYCTVFQAELLAICRSTREIIKHPKDSFGIYSDSRSSLEAVTNNRSLHPLVVEIRRNLEECKRRNKRVELFWIKAHAGLEGNERADQLAKEAALKLKTKPDYDLCPVSCVRRQIRLGSLEVWNKRYSDGETAATTKLFFPDAIKACSIVRHVKPNGILTQVMTGHGGFSAYLNRFKCKEDPSCICEPEKPETVEHIIIEYPVFGRESCNAQMIATLMKQNDEHTVERKRAKEKEKDKNIIW